MTVPSPKVAPKRRRRLPPALAVNIWKPGQSGNPAGHSGLYGEPVRLARQAAPGAIKRLIQLLASEDERVASVAANAILERAFGKAREYDPNKERVEQPPFDPSKLSPDELHIVEAALRMMLRASGTDDHRALDDR
jgi:hypothetical protein